VTLEQNTTDWSRDGPQTRNQRRPAGSILGPVLWNVAYNSLLGMEVLPGVHLVGFADDLAVVGVASTGQLLEETLNTVLESIDTWKGPGACPPKSEAVLLTNRWAACRSVGIKSP